MDRSHEPTPKKAEIHEVFSAELLEFQVFRNITSCRLVSSCPTMWRIAVSSKLRWLFISRHGAISEKTRILSKKLTVPTVRWLHGSTWVYPRHLVCCGPVAKTVWVTRSKSEPNTFADTHYKSRLPQVIYVIIKHRLMTRKVTTTVNNYVGPSRSGMHISCATS